MSEGFSSSQHPYLLSFIHVRKKTAKKKGGPPFPMEFKNMALNVADTHPVDAP